MVNPTRAPEVFAEALELLNLADINDLNRTRNALIRMIASERKWNNQNPRLANFEDLQRKGKLVVHLIKYLDNLIKTTPESSEDTVSDAQSSTQSGES